MSDDVITQERANELAGMFGGEETLDVEAAEELISEEGESPKQEEPQEEPDKEEWVHEPTGKKFDNELDFLRWESGWKSNQYGTEMKQLKEQLEELKDGKGSEEPEQPSENDIKERMIGEFIKNLPEGVRDDEALKLFSDMGFEYIKNYDALLGGRLKGLEERLHQIENNTTEKLGRLEHKVDPKVEAEVLEKHPRLKEWPFEERMAMIKELSSQSGQAEKASNKLSDKVSAKAADHVESSARSAPPSGGEAGMQGWLEEDFSKKSIQEQESTLTEMIQRAGQKGAFDLY